MTIAVTIASILISIILTTVLTILLSGGIATSSMIIATVVPTLIAPPFAYITLRLTYQLDLAEERLRQLAITDELTQAYNRRYFIEIATKVLAGTKRYGDSFAIIIFDIDDFKRINDTYGHAAGDQVLRMISEICTTHIRDSDIFARYGGEEFVILVQRCSPTDIVKFAERIRITLSQARVLYNQVEIQFTVSMGAGIFDSQTPDLDTILTRADAALYAAKKQGKNCTVLM
ncbi:MAG: GGDEF domain-containing protein [Chloroflexi bacterium]|nr:GGDEF domain-containing protein [Chloroflexota bacterium]MBI5704596.1 GGDEF domain-containing protein [Chloroflexota bacterium]